MTCVETLAAHVIILAWKNNGASILFSQKLLSDSGPAGALAHVGEGPGPLPAQQQEGDTEGGPPRVLG